MTLMIACARRALIVLCTCRAGAPITAIPVLLDHLAEKEQLDGALVTIDAVGCQVEIAAKIVEHRPIFCCR